MMRRLLMGLVLVAAATATQAQLRAIPPEAKRGYLSHVQGMTVELNGQRVDLAAGAQIRDARNLVVVPTAVPAGSLVKYLLSADKKLQRVWILSPQEAAQPDPVR